MLVGLERAVELLHEGNPVAFATETVYALGADARNEHAIRRVFEIKGRPSTNPLIVHINTEAMARSCATEWPDRASKLAARFWPGPLTIVVPSADTIPAIARAGGPTVALRAPNHPVALELITEFGGPLVGPSANTSGGVSPTRADHVEHDFDGSLPVLDGGICATGIESTVISLANTTPCILRPGVISADELANCLGETVTSACARDNTNNTPAASPGLIGKHYAPRTRCILVDEKDLHDIGAREHDAVVIAAKGTLGGFEMERGWTVVWLPSDAGDYARSIYSSLREADARNTKLIIIVRPHSDGPIWDAIRDRLTRAAAPDQA